MNKYVTLAASILLGLCFLTAVIASFPIVFNFIQPPPMPEGTPAAHFMAAFLPTGYAKFVKMFEFVGALVVMFPRTRNLGLLLLGPVIVNIIAFHALVDDPWHLLNPLIIVIVPCALLLFWDGRKQFSGLLN